MQHRTKDLFLQFGKVISSISVGATKVPLCHSRASSRFPAPPGTPDGLCYAWSEYDLDIGFRFAINHRTDIGGQATGLPIRHSAIAPRSIFNVWSESHLAGTARAAPNNADPHCRRRGQYIHDDLFGQC